MAGRISNVEQWLSKALAADVVVFDLDGTLIESDFANFLSYEAAIAKLGLPPPQLIYEPRKRITRGVIGRLVPSISKEELGKVVREKERLYKMYLHKTTPNNEVVHILDQSIDKEKVLATNSSRERADLLLAYHGLSEKFTRKFYKEKADPRGKYQRVLDWLRGDGRSVVIFENEEHAIESLISAGIDPECVVMVGNSC